MPLCIVIESRDKIRHQDVGDWQFTDGGLRIYVKELGNWHLEFLVALHELVEAWLCRNEGIPEGSVDMWDNNYEGELNPGDDPLAPYHRQHKIAEVIERLIAIELGINWESYEQKLEEACGHSDQKS